ncbi:hypothetical protein [Mesorhizobium sp.]|uniref:hypothetical protein n=1 Tax=Mesorhizobium sp. TaxID=1871066 RepID=UPI000FE7686E|nr:hypothetical protein [Mesorhizobium sp.]RWE03856.1 MAG: hypothetical protein EOS40_01695 [Mesorhizobium sp.]
MLPDDDDIAASAWRQALKVDELVLDEFTARRPLLDGRLYKALSTLLFWREAFELAVERDDAEGQQKIAYEGAKVMRLLVDEAAGWICEAPMHGRSAFEPAEWENDARLLLKTLIYHSDGTPDDLAKSARETAAIIMPRWLAEHLSFALDGLDNGEEFPLVAAAEVPKTGVLPRRAAQGFAICFVEWLRGRTRQTRDSAENEVAEALGVDPTMLPDWRKRLLKGEKELNKTFGEYRAAGRIYGELERSGSFTGTVSAALWVIMKKMTEGPTLQEFGAEYQRRFPHPAKPKKKRSTLGR